MQTLGLRAARFKQSGLTIGSVAQLVSKRPVSPHVFEIDGKGMHYKMPINAVTSIMNRVTGTVLTLGARCPPGLCFMPTSHAALLLACLVACLQDRFQSFASTVRTFWKPARTCNVAAVLALSTSSLALLVIALHSKPRAQPYGAGAWGAGAVALQGDLVAAVDAFKAAAPMLVLPAKFAVAFPLVYHYLGGVRHVFWDKSHYGNMARPQAARGFRVPQSFQTLSSRWLVRVGGDLPAGVPPPGRRAARVLGQVALRQHGAPLGSSRGLRVPSSP